MHFRIKATHNPAIFRGNAYDRIVAGTIIEVNGKRWEHPYVAVPKGITFEQIEWVRETPVRTVLREWKVPASTAGKHYIVKETPHGQRTCNCDGYHYRRRCRHINEVK